MTRDRIHDLTIAPYDQVMAFTQELINVGFKTLWQRNPHEPIRSIGDHEVKFTDFKFGPPKVVIRYRSQSPNYVVLRLNIASGNYKYYKNDDDDAMTTIDVKNWYLAFPVDLSLARVPDTKLADLRKTIEVPGDYSVSQLLYDLTTIEAGQIDQSLSSFSTELTDHHIQVLVAHIKTENFMDEEKRTLGYLTHDVSSNPATFKPSDIQFQTYPWFDISGNDIGAGIDGDHLLNYLCYNEMTDGRPPPTTNVFLPWTANFTDGNASALDDSQIDLGMFVMSKDNFWNRWLIPQLKYINMCVHYKVSDQSCYAEGPNHYRWGTNKQVAANGSESKDEDWIAKESSDGAGNPTWTWTMNYDPGDVQDQSRLEIGIKGATNAHNYSRVEFTPGTGQIKVSGKTTVYEYCEVWRGLIHHGHSDADIQERQHDWSFNLSLVSIVSGGLQVKMSGISSNWTRVKDQYDLEYNRGSFWDDNYKNVKDQLGNFEQILANGLNDVHKLFYPAGGMLYYHDPVFSRNGDLQTSVRLNPDAIPGKNRNSRGEARVNPAAGTEKSVVMEEDPKKMGKIGSAQDSGQ